MCARARAAVSEAAGGLGAFVLQVGALQVEAGEQLPAAHFHPRVAALQGCLQGLRIYLLRLLHLAPPLQAAGMEQEGFGLLRGGAVPLQIINNGNNQRVIDAPVGLRGGEPGLCQLVEDALVAVGRRRQAVKGIEQADVFFIAAIVRGEDEVEPCLLSGGQDSVVCTAARGNGCTGRTQAHQEEKEISHSFYVFQKHRKGTLFCLLLQVRPLQSGKNGHGDPPVPLYLLLAGLNL